MSERFMTQEMKATVAGAPCESAAVATQLSTVVTRMSFPGSSMQVWRHLKFYEEISGRPPLLLRLLLPVPIRTTDRLSEIGRETECIYEDGHLLKRVTRVEQGRLYEFEIVEQDLSVGGGMLLSGGRYTLRELPGERTEVALQTRYASSQWPRWFWTPLEHLVCHWFHRYLLRSMRRTIEAE